MNGSDQSIGFSGGIRDFNLSSLYMDLNVGYAIPVTNRSDFLLSPIQIQITLHSRKTEGSAMEILDI